MSETPVHGQASCRSCGDTWTSRAEAHCTGCHAQFVTAGVFDRHLRRGGCVPPGDVRGRDGRPQLEACDRGGRTVWRTWTDPDAPRPAHWRARS